MLRIVLFLGLALMGLVSHSSAQIASVTVSLDPPDLLITGSSTLINWQVEQPNTPQNFDLTFFRSCEDGANVLKSVQPNNAPNSNGSSASTSGSFLIGLCPGDRVQNFINIIAREVTSPGLEQSNTVTVLSDTVPPDPPNLSPESEGLGGTTIFTPTFQVTGNVDNSTPPGNATDKPETSGSVTVYFVDGTDPDTGEENRVVLGGGLIQPNSNFIATVDLSTFAFGQTENLFIIATDPLGQASNPKSIGNITRGAGGTATLENLELVPAAGSITNHTGVLVRGSVSGAVPPFAVKFYVNGFLNSEIGGLSSGETFAHTLNLTTEGNNCIAAEIENSNTPIFKAGQQDIGCIELDQTPPQAPQILSPPPGLTLITAGPEFSMRLFVEADKNTSNNLFPKLFLDGPSGVDFSPLSPVEITTGAGEQNIDVDIRDLEDGSYNLQFKAEDEVGNTGPESTARFSFTKDTQSPIVEQVRVNGVVAPQQDPPIFVASTTVQIEILLNESSTSAPILNVQPSNGSAFNWGLVESGSDNKRFVYSSGVATGLDGPMALRVSGGGDQAGNTIDFELQDAFVADTLAPSISQMIPASSSVLSQSPERIRLVYSDPLPAGAVQNSGVDAKSADIVLKDSTGGNVPIEVIVFDPITVDITPNSPLNVEGNYQIESFISDKAGNTSNKETRFFSMDLTQVHPDDITCVPENDGFARFGTPPLETSEHFVSMIVSDDDYQPTNSSLNLKNLREIPQLIPGDVSYESSTNELRYTLKELLPSDSSKDGKYLIEGQISDLSGNVTAKTCTFVYDNCAPSVQSVFPTTGAVVGRNLKHVSAVIQDCMPRFDVEISDIDTTESSIKVFRNEEGGKTEIQSRLRYETVPESRAQKLLLEFTDSSGAPTNLDRNGEYEIQVEVVDRAGNRSAVSSSTFIVDTHAPRIETEKLDDGQILSGDSYYLKGRVRDADGGSGMEEVRIRVQSLNNETPATTLLNFTEMTMTGLPLPPFNPDPPWHDFNYELNLDVAVDTEARITLRAIDNAGNQSDHTYDVTLLGDGLPQPNLSLPVSGYSTASYFVDFKWDIVSTAHQYEVEIITPAGNRHQTVVDTPYTRINMANYAEGEGNYRYNVRAIDSLGNRGPKSPNSSFYVDQSNPRITSIQIQDPSPESQGAITAGETRFLLNFSEPMDLEYTPIVTLAPVDPGGFEPLELEILSFQETTALARLMIQEPEPGKPVPHDLAKISVTQARDQAQNPLEPVENGIAIFEVQPGPLFDVKFFVNPVDSNALTIAIKAFTAHSGLALKLPNEPAVTAISTQDDEVGLSLSRITDAAFAANLHLSTMGYNSFHLNITGTDEYGNTNSRTLFLPMNNIRASVSSVVQHPRLRIEVPPHATVKDARVLMLDPELMVMPRAESLTHLTDLPSSPSSLKLSLPSRIKGSLSSTASTTALSQNAVLLVQNAGEWEFASRIQNAGQGSFEASSHRIGPMAIFADPHHPTVEEGPIQGDQIKFFVEDKGIGVDPESLVFHDHRGQWKARLLPDSHQAILSVPDHIDQIDGFLEVRDRAGNQGRSPHLSLNIQRNFTMNPQVYPNPAKNSLYLRILANFPPDSAEMKIYDSAGGLVNRLALDVTSPRDAHRWDLRDRHGREVANGVYFLRLKASSGGKQHRRDLKFAVLR